MTDIHPEADYQRFLDEGRFMLLRARGSGRCFFYPRVAEPGTGSTDLEWIEASGIGTVHSTTVVRQRSGNYNVSLIDLAEGPRMMCRVEGIPPEDVAIGMAVRAKIAPGEEGAFILFEPAE